MRVRLASEEDRRLVREIHDRAGYGFALPEELLGMHVVEEDGAILAAAAYEPAAQVVAVVSPSVGSPFKRIDALKMLHAPLALEVLAHGAQSVFAFCDPQFRGFDRRMMALGWHKKLWPCVFLERPEIQKRFGRAA